jgi:hypothetical protein
MSDKPNVCCEVRALQDAVFRASEFYQKACGRRAGFETLDLDYRLYRLRNALNAQDKCADADCPWREQERLGEDIIRHRA